MPVTRPLLIEESCQASRRLPGKIPFAPIPVWSILNSQENPNRFFPENYVFGILLIFLLTAVSLALLFWIGGAFLQGYFYTQPDENLYWRAPAAGLSLAAFFSLWCLAIVWSPGASPTNLPYDTLFRFSPRDDMLAEPAKELWVVRKKGQPVLYKRERMVDSLAPNRFQYRETSLARKPLESNNNIEAILLEHNGEKVRFVPVKGGDEMYRSFVSDKGGWEMREFDDGPTGQPTTLRLGRFAINLFFNFFHLALWFVCLWLLLRFNIGHSLVLGFSLWLGTTLIILPIFFSYAGELAQRRAIPTTRTPAT
jgi:hypothetical protein